MTKHLNKILEQNLISQINVVAQNVGSEMANNINYITNRKNNPNTQNLNDWIGGSLGVGFTSVEGISGEWAIAFIKPQGDMGWFQTVRTNEVSTLNNVQEVFSIVRQ